MRLYLVFREGVYRHALMSITRTEAEAHHNAKAALEAEHDSYHAFGVYWVDTNKALSYVRQSQYSPHEDTDRAKLIGTYTQSRFVTKPTVVTYRPATA